MGLNAFLVKLFSIYGERNRQILHSSELDGTRRCHAVHNCRAISEMALIRFSQIFKEKLPFLHPALGIFQKRSCIADVINIADHTVTGFDHIAVCFDDGIAPWHLFQRRIEGPVKSFRYFHRPLCRVIGSSRYRLISWYRFLTDFNAEAAMRSKEP